MFDIFIDTHFAGAHHLRDYPGDCEKPHGHNWKVKVTVHATELDQYGMGIDFKVLKKIVKEVIDNYDLKDGFDMWTEDETDGRQRIGEASLMPLMVKAVQELSAKVEELEDKLNNKE